MVQRYNWIRVVTSNYMLLFGTIHSELLCVSIQRWACLCPFPRMHSSAGRRACKPVVREDGVGATLAELWPEWGSRSRGERAVGAAEGVVSVCILESGLWQGSHQRGEICLVIAGSQGIAAHSCFWFFCRVLKKSNNILTFQGVIISSWILLCILQQMLVPPCVADQGWGLSSSLVPENQLKDLRSGAPLAQVWEATGLLC